jgi:hypothetical protein
MKMEPRLTLVTLGVRDLARAVAFYRDGLGLEKDERWDEIAFFKMGTTILALFSRDELAKDAHVSPEGSGFSAVTLAHNVATEAEVDALLDYVATIGGKVIAPAERKPWGGRSGYFMDPDGHIWEIACNPGL